MKCRAIKAAVLLTFVLALFLLIISCGPSPQNNNQNQTATAIANANANASREEVTVYDPACSEANIDTRVVRAQERIDADIGRDDELKEGRVKVLVKKSASGHYLELLVEGFAGGEDELNDLTRILRKFMHKEKKCVFRVRFVPKGTIPPAASPTPAEGDRTTSIARTDYFEWAACEWPKEVCPDGVCGPPCMAASPSPSPNAP